MILQHLQGKKLVLASGSPRRQELVKGLGVPVEVRPRPIDESYPAELKREEVALYLASKKADAFVFDLSSDEIILTGDTTVYLEGDILNKPESREEAVGMLRRLSGQTHTVITAVCLLSLERRVVFHDETEVTFGELSDDEINYYVDEYQPYDKAGAYGAQDFIGFIGIVDMRGSYYNVMGFPMHRVYAELKGW
jgi:septum formation protein